MILPLNQSFTTLDIDMAHGYAGDNDDDGIQDRLNGTRFASIFHHLVNHLCFSSCPGSP